MNAVTAERVVGYPPQALREYAFLADGHRGALLGPRGDVSFLCAPRWDSPAVFSHLFGGTGVYAVTPTETFVWGGYYEPGSLIWRSRWMTTSCLIECREALAQPADPHRLVLLRRIEPGGPSPATVDVSLQLGADFGRVATTKQRRDDQGRWTMTAGNLTCRWSGAAEATHSKDGVLRLTLEIPAGEHHDLILEISDRTLPEPVDAERAWSATASYWREHVPAFEESAAPRDSRHAYALLRGLTQPGGGMVAAATLGLPERAEAARNYDYRYVWLRDQAYAGIAAGVHEPLPLLDEATAFTTARLLEHGDTIAPAYRLDGTLPPKEQTIDLPGYPGGQVKVGNWVRGQFQLDSCGEMLQLYSTSARHDRLSSEDHRALTTVVDIIEKRWKKPEAGVWELDDAWWTQSRLACVAGLRSIADQPGAVDTTRALGLADAIMAETSKRSLGPGGAWQQAPDRPRVDTSLLLPPVRGALSPDDPRSLATLDAVSEQLVEDGYVYRYAVGGQPLGQAEGAFLMCGFIMCLAQLAAGNHVEAFRWFERQRAACGPAGLLSEEFDVRQRQLRGNLPQGFVHAMLLECSQRLGDAPGGSAR
ncbi:glycoside hydrolase family 15 protein [Lapillicoccus sp.]|uniref:glycoside hydrolase family 15 protein n=1 Tax=Lapillicoccus sp. TaxID=1909287 RepID=UPI003264D000